MIRALSSVALVAATALNTVAQTTPPTFYGDALSAHAPQSMEELWADIDMRAEPLDVEILKEWEEDGVKLKVLRYRVGVFKGQKAMMAAGFDILGATAAGGRRSTGDLWPFDGWKDHLVGGAKLEPAKRITWTTWPFYKGHGPLEVSGLLGPVILIGNK